MAEILQPRLAEWEVRDTKDELAKEDNSKDLCQRIQEAIYFQAFKGQGVGRKTNTNLDHITPSKIQAYVKDQFVGNLVTVVGVGINHTSLLDFAEAFSYLPLEGKNADRSVYYGGNFIEEDCSIDGSTVTIAYPANPENVIALRVLSNILGAGRVSKERTNIGDGASSRLFSLVTSSSNIHSASSFVLDSSNGGGNYPFFVLSGFGSGEAASDLSKGLSEELSRLDNISEQEVRKAVNLAKVQFSTLLEQRDSLKNLLYYGNGKNPVQSLSVFDSITASSLKNVVSSTFSAKPTVVCIGNLNGF